MEVINSYSQLVRWRTEDAGATWTQQEVLTTSNYHNMNALGNWNVANKKVIACNAQLNVDYSDIFLKEIK